MKHRSNCDCNYKTYYIYNASIKNISSHLLKSFRWHLTKEDISMTQLNIQNEFNSMVVYLHI